MIVYPVAELAGYFANSREAVGFVDPETLTVIYGNRAFELSVEDFQLKSGKSPLQELSPVQSAMEQCCRELKAVSCELPQWDSLIELLPVQLQHADGSMQLALHYKLFSLQSSRSLEFAEDALSSLPYSTWACSVNGEIFWTSRASKQYAYGAPNVTQLGHQEHMAKIHPDDVQQASLSFSTGMADEKMPCFRYRLRSHGGTYEWFMVIAEPVRTANGSIRYWLASSINIHAFVLNEERMKAEVQRLKQQLMETQALASSAQKMELVSHLAGGVAHDLNNLLFVMRMHLGSLQRHMAAPEAGASLQAIQDCIRKAARLSTQLSGFSGRLPQNATALSPSKFVAEMHSLFTQAVGAEVGFHIQMAEEMPAVLADRSYLENALINLLINARDAVDGRGCVTLGIDVVQQSHEGIMQPFVAFSVSDDGIGMSHELQSKVFEPFFTTKSPDMGTGLGLAMVKNFADNSGGYIKVRSTLGEGSTMTLLLPLAGSGESPEEVQETDAPLLLPLAKGSAGSVLLIEDDEAVRQAVSMVLIEHGYRIVAAANPAHAIGLLELGIRVNLILSDIRMPGKKTVHDLIAHVESSSPAPIIFITGYSADLVIQEGLIEGRYPVLFKPFGAQDLLQKIAELIH